jgi:5-hydroxyisourate hydrolase-like protein (transthyretin family)
MPAVDQRLIIFLLALCLFSCGRKEQAGDRKPTYPVTGTLLVDGSPAEEVQITCYPASDVNNEDPTMPQANTAADGTFKFSTYVAGDGLPEGDYVLTFFWGQLNVFTREYVGPDKLNDRYRDPKNAKVSFKVEKGKPTKLGTVELTTK